jgi:hypothetical protein
MICLSGSTFFDNWSDRNIPLVQTKQGEKIIMRWEKGNHFVEIVSGVSTDVQVVIWYINTNLDFKDLPVAFRKQVPKTDEEGYESLKLVASNWAAQNGYQLMSSDTA